MIVPKNQSVLSFVVTYLFFSWLISSDKMKDGETREGENKGNMICVYCCNDF